MRRTCKYTLFEADHLRTLSTDDLVPQGCLRPMFSLFLLFENSKAVADFDTNAVSKIDQNRWILTRTRSVKSTIKSEIGAGGSALIRRQIDLSRAFAPLASAAKSSSRGSSGTRRRRSREAPRSASACQQLSRYRHPRRKAKQAH